VKRLVAAVLFLAVVGAIVFVAVDRSKPEWYQRLRYPLEYQELVRKNARTFDVDPALIAAVIYAESRFRPDAVSEAGAIGLMQLLPETGKWIAATGGERFRVKDLYDPKVNVRYGSFYLDRLLDKYGNVRFALAAYHAGQGNADRWLASSGEIGFPDTRAYVANVLEFRDIYRATYERQLRVRGEPSAVSAG
jgi:soluble lytic murein transglycosylase